MESSPRARRTMLTSLRSQGIRVPGSAAQCTPGLLPAERKPRSEFTTDTEVGAWPVPAVACGGKMKASEKRDPHLVRCNGLQAIHSCQRGGGSATALLMRKQTYRGEIKRPGSLSLRNNSTKTLKKEQLPAFCARLRRQLMDAQSPQDQCHPDFQHALLCVHLAKKLRDLSRI